MKQTQVNMVDLILMMDRCDTVEDLKIILLKEDYWMGED